jgi:molybdenum cofactor cytidylyltransferase
MKTNQYAAVVLAAGFSRRMQQFKPLLSLGNETIADHLIATFLRSGVDVYLVSGYRQSELLAGIKTWDIRIVENPDYHLGMFSSIQAGIRALKGNYRAAFIAPVDIPLVSHATISKLMLAADKNPGKVIHPTFQGDRGHPPLIPAEIFPAISSYRRDGSLKSVLHVYKDSAVDIQVSDSNILFDIDDQADYEKLLKRFQNHETALETE